MVVGAPELAEPISLFIRRSAPRWRMRSIATPPALSRMSSCDGSRLGVRTISAGRRRQPTARILQPRLEWSDTERDQAIRDYEMELHRTLSVFRAPTARAISSAAKRADQTG